MFDQLINCELFSGISTDEVSILDQQIQYKIKKFGKEGLIKNNGDECNALLIVIKGSVRGEMNDMNGKTIKIEDIGAYRPLAPAFLFGSNHFYPVTLLANEPSELVFFDKAMVLKMFRLNEKILSNYLNYIANRAQFLTQKIKFLSFSGIKQKFASYILQQAGEKFKTIELKQNQSEIAELFGVTRPALARVIREMDKEGVISAKGKFITLNNKQALVNAVFDC